VVGIYHTKNTLILEVEIAGKRKIIKEKNGKGKDIG